MTIVSIFGIFITFSLFGWVIDTTYRSVLVKKYSPGTKYFFDPVYGIGAVVLALFYGNVNFFVPLQIFVAGLLITLVELLSGIFICKVVGHRIWDYSNSAWNFKGHIDILHSFFWIVLALVYYVLGFLFPLY